MTKAPSPLLGYNNNVRHKNRVFHIQTEDSGIKHPHIITHIFMDGGRILKSVKTSYAEHIGADKLGDIVRQLMKEQHKSMFRALRDGELDAIVDAALGVAAPSEPALVAPKKGADRSPPAAPAEEAAPRTQRGTGFVGPTPEGLDYDSAEADQSGGFRPQGDLPPPPPTVLAARASQTTSGRYRAVDGGDERTSVARARSERPPPISERPPRAERTPPPRKSERPPRIAPKSERPPRVGEHRFVAAREERVKRTDPRAEPPSEPEQPTAKSVRGPASAAVRPAAIFGQARPQQSSIFGEDIISDKSLDEVILSYLAEDLEEGSK